MNTIKLGCLIRKSPTAVLLVCLWAGNLVAAEEGAHAVRTDDSIVHLKEFQKRLDWMASRLNEVQVDPDAVADSRAGGITLQQHAADVAAARDEFTQCLAALKKRIADKEESGTASDADKAQFKKCIDDCGAILSTLNNLHLNASLLGSADHKTTWVLDGMAKHKKAVAELQSLAAQCPDQIHTALKHAEIKKGSAGASSPKPPSSEPTLHLKEFQRRLDWMAKRLKEVQPDPDAVQDSTSGGITLQQHSSDVAATRDEFTKCLAAMKKAIADKEESGTATAADKEQFKKCSAHCESVLNALNNMHLNASLLGAADHKTTWVLDGFAKHKKGMAELEALAAQCPEMIGKTMECCKKH